MANVISLDTATHPNLTQVLVNTEAGLFDFKAQQAAGSVTIVNKRKKAAVLEVVGPAANKKALKET